MIKKLLTSPDTRDIVIDVVGTNKTSGNVGYLGVAQFGSVLEWGSRGRRFESSHPDFYFLMKIRKFFYTFISVRYLPCFSLVMSL